jgi:hypothetical protein
MVNEVRELFEFIASGGRSVLSGTSRAASTQQEEPKHDEMITEVLNGLIVTRPARKYTDLNQPKQQEQKQEESEPVIIELGNSKAGSSVPSYGTNPVKELFDFLRCNGRI